MRYAPHDTLVAPARASASLWRLAGGLVVLVALFLLIGLAAGATQEALIAPESQAAWWDDLYTATTPLSALANLYFFAFLILALAIAMRLVHHRAWRGLIGPPVAAFAQFGQVAKVLVPLFALIFLLPDPEGLNLSRNMDLGLWLTLLPLTLLGLLIQTGTEELLFRGYLQSQLAARFRHPVIWIGLPSLAFGMLHFDPGADATAAWLIVLWAVSFAVLTADLTARSGTLGPAVALHLVNNLLAIAIAAPAGSFDGLALYTFPFSISDSELLKAWMPVELMILLCSWLAARLSLRV